MKKLYFSSVTLFVILMLSSSAFPQIPNNSFENWDQGDPVGWWTPDIPGFLDAVTQSSDAWEGSSAALMTVIDAGGGLAYVPSLGAGNNGQGIPVSQRHGSFGGYYKFSPSGNETFNVGINMFLGLDQIGTGGAQIQTATTTYIEFNVPINYSTGDTPDLALISISVATAVGGGTIGSWALVDYVMFGSASDVEQISGTPHEYSLNQNYPNPFNPTTKIRFDIPERSFVTLKVFDVLGSEITTLVNEEKPVGSYEVEFIANNLPSGIYFYTLQAAGFVETKKMILMK